jgi:hypothetical protein
LRASRTHSVRTQFKQVTLVIKPDSSGVVSLVRKALQTSYSALVLLLSLSRQSAAARSSFVVAVVVLHAVLQAEVLLSFISDT